jgi:hypothetical protein
MRFKEGDKVVVKSKFGTQRELNISSVYKRMLKKEQKFLYVIRIVEDSQEFSKPYYVLDLSMDTIGGDYYYEEDVESYLKEERKQKLMKINETHYTN